MRKIFRNKELAAGSERRTSGVGGSWNESRPRMGTVWLFLRVRVKCRCHRILAFVCGKLLNQGNRGRDGGEKKMSRSRQQECPDFEITKSGAAGFVVAH